jgi:hypothetical protein
VTDPSSVWVLYTAKYDVGRQHSRIIPESVRVLLASNAPISAEQVKAEQERTGLGAELTVTQMDVPADLPARELAAYTTQQIANEPEFDFWDEVIGDDIVVEGTAYNSELYTPDGEGGVRRLTDDEQAAWLRRDLAEEIADEAISRFVHHQASGVNPAEARREAATDTAWDYGVDVRDADPTDRYLPGTVPALPTLDAYRIADEAIERFLSYQHSGETADAAQQFAVAQSTPPHGFHEADRRPDREPGQRSPQSADIAGELPTALSSVGTAGHITELRRRAADLRAELTGAAPARSAPPRITASTGRAGTEGLPVARVDGVGPDSHCQPDVGL